MPNKTYNIRLRRTGSAARSIMARALATTMRGGRFRGFRAGSQPGAKPNPFPVDKARHTGYPLHTLRRQHSEECARADAPEMDAIATACDNAAGESRALWPGHAVSAQRCFEDPAGADGRTAQKHAVSPDGLRPMVARLDSFLVRSVETLKKPAIQREPKEIGRTLSPAPGYRP